MSADLEPDIHREVQRYYGETLESSDDLRTSACCTSAAPSGPIKEALKKIHPEVSSRYYGCGLLLPEQLPGCRVLDLGSGAGRDVYLLAQLVGESGSVVGVDMTPAQLEVANRYRDFHAEAFGYAEGNVEFVEANIEKLDEANLASESFDVIVSNCVINLAVDKAAVLREAYRLLKPGGEMYFADVYADRRVPEELRQDPVLYGECLSGAMYWRDFERTARECGFTDPRVVTDEPIAINDDELAVAVGDIRFFSITYRLFRDDSLEAGSEDYGLSVTYGGGLSESPEAFLFDRDTRLPAGEKTAVSANTWHSLKNSRLASLFEFHEPCGGPKHRGSFEPLPFAADAPSTSSCC